MNSKELYDLVMESERQENIMHIAKDNSERRPHGDKDYLSIAALACEKFNQEFECSAVDNAKQSKGQEKVLTREARH